MQSNAVNDMSDIPPQRYIFDIAPTDGLGSAPREQSQDLKSVIRLERKRTDRERARLREALRLQDRPRPVPGRGQRPELHAARRDPGRSGVTWESERDGEILVFLTEHEHETIYRPLPGFEGQNFLPSRDELLRHIAEVEKRDQRLRLLEYLTARLRDEDAVHGATLRRRSGSAGVSSTAALGTAILRLRDLLRRFRSAFLLSAQPAVARRLRTAPAMLAVVAGGLLLGVLLMPYLREVLRQRQAAVVEESTRASQAVLRGVTRALQEDLGQAEADFAEGVERFGRATRKVSIVGRGLALIADTFSPRTRIGAGVHLLEAGTSYAKSARALSQYLGMFLGNGVGKIQPQEFITSYLTDDDLAQAKALLASAVGELERGSRKLASVPEEILPPHLRPHLAAIKERTPPLLEKAKRFQERQDAILAALGYNGPRRYLILFQNNAELRPTGGFIGSYGIVDVLDGKVTKVAVEDVFDLDGQLVAKVIPPRPIQKISTAWSLHDANWFFDFAASARKISWFYEKAGGSSLDGVIALTPQTLVRLLRLTGPIALPPYQVTLDAQTVLDELAYAIETAPQRSDLASPKRVLKDLAQLILEQLRERISKHDLPRLVSAIGTALGEREASVYFREPALQTLIEEQGWGGRVARPPGDYLAVVHANINGFKTDRVIAETLAHDTEIREDGSIVNTLTIRRTHRGSPHQKYDALYNRVNADYLRVFVPAGSKLLKAEGATIEPFRAPIDYATANFAADPDLAAVESTFRLHEESKTHLYEEADKTVFANWAFVSPRESVTIRYTYLLPWKVKTASPDRYTLYVQKQAGTLPSLSVTIRIPKTLRIVKALPLTTQTALQRATFSIPALRQDAKVGIVLAPR